MSDLDHLEKRHAAEATETVATLLQDVGPEGGSVTRDDLEILIRAAFLAGLVDAYTVNGLVMRGNK